MHCRSARPHQQGFTLAELMISLVVIGLLMAIMVPNVRSQIPRYQLNGAARQVLRDLMAARMKAISQNTTVKVSFPDTHTYTVCNFDSTQNKCIGTVSTKNIQQDYRDVTLTANNNPVFLSRGTATNLATITLTNVSGSKDITVNITGRVKIKVG